ncbi:MAG: hypothetical protein MZW92_77075 [Comamonadaceae bacterium]|nr:hypothetical protein [Comamonadaceae bacterium]
MQRDQVIKRDAAPSQTPAAPSQNAAAPARHRNGRAGTGERHEPLARTDRRTGSRPGPGGAVLPSRSGRGVRYLRRAGCC